MEARRGRQEGGADGWLQKLKTQSQVRAAGSGSGLSEQGRARCVRTLWWGHEGPLG